MTPFPPAAELAAQIWQARVVRALSQRENAVYEVALPDGTPAALRLHRQGYQGAEAIRSELWWCQELSQAGLPVPRPVPLPDGGLMAELPSGQSASLVEWVSGDGLGLAGVPLAGRVADQIARHHALGGLLARVHNVSDGLDLPDWFTRHHWDRAGLVGDSPTWGRFWDHPAATPDQAVTLCTARDWLDLRLADYDRAGADLGLIHADALRENVMVQGDALTLIDFDDAGFGYRLYDLGSVLSQNLFEPAYPEIRAGLIEGYRAQRPLREDLVDAFTLARTMASVGWTMPRLPPDHPVIVSHIARAVGFAARVMG